MLYVGVDAHKATSQITVVNETGSILKRAKVASTSSASSRRSVNTMSRSPPFLRRAIAGDQFTTG